MGILIAGGAGFTGNYLCEKYVKESCVVGET
jgi:nucleoside-diphosphate-sugar epimerase